MAELCGLSNVSNIEEYLLAIVALSEGDKSLRPVNKKI